MHGFKASRNRPSISHMFFADDSLIFCQAKPDEWNNFLEILNIYGRASGQKVNFQRSAIKFSKGLSFESRNMITQLTRFTKVSGFERYLWLPEVTGRNKNDIFFVY